jgi:poly(hydroxyalkanoate) depolymerase family esterase
MPFAHLLLSTQTAVASFGSNPGSLLMYEHVPAALPANAPLVVVLHGCTQTAASMESSGWDTLADAYGFAVVYPQQQAANNIESCFNWFDGATDDARGAGEAESIDEMVQYEISTSGIDASRVFVTGFSSGAAMTAVMAATYPDVFGAASIMEGLPFGCATTETDAFTCMNPGVTKTGDQWGALVKAAYTTSTFPRIQIWEGTADTTVAPMNEQQLALQWTDVAGVAMTPSASGSVGSASWTDYGTSAQPTVETFLVSGMDHAVALGDDGSIACPGTATTYFEDHGVCSTVRAAQFFGIVPSYANNGSGSGSGGGGGGSGSGSGDGGGGGGNGDNNGSGSAGTMLDAGGCNAGRGSNGAGALLAIAGVVLGLRRRRG